MRKFNRKHGVKDLKILRKIQLQNIFSVDRVIVIEILKLLKDQNNIYSLTHMHSHTFTEFGVRLLRMT